MTPEEIARFIAKSCLIEADDENVAGVGETLIRGELVTHCLVTRTPNGSRTESFTFPETLLNGSEGLVLAWIGRERQRRKQVEQEEFMRAMKTSRP